MKPDVLFWFYKDFETCRERLLRLRKLNRSVRVYALYGGSLLEAEMAQGVVHELVDDFYVYPHEKDSIWKWIHGDQMIATWYMDRGQYLEWENIFIMQWDMLISESLEKLFCNLQPHEILLSGLRPFSTVSPWWPWANPEKSDILLFKELLREKFNYDGELFVCLFIIICLPRIFLQKYTAAGCLEIGFLEYKIPTMAHIFNIPVCNNHDFDPWWAANPETRNIPRCNRVLNAIGQEIPLSVILGEFAKRDGNKLFHPVFKVIPIWMENRHIANVLSYFFRFFEVFSQSRSKLKQYVRNNSIKYFN